MAGDRSLHHDDLLKDLKDVHQWQELGTALGVSQSKIDDIHRRHGDNVTECQRDILNEWIVSNPQCKWGDLVFALQKIGKNHVATNIARKYFGAEFRPSVVEKTPPPRVKKTKNVSGIENGSSTPSPSSSLPPTPQNAHPPNITQEAVSSESSQPSPPTLDEPDSSSHQEEVPPPVQDQLPPPSHEEPKAFSTQEQEASSHPEPASQSAQDPRSSNSLESPPPSYQDTVPPRSRSPETSAPRVPVVSDRPSSILQRDYCYFLLPLLIAIFGVFAFYFLRKTRNTH